MTHWGEWVSLGKKVGPSSIRFLSWCRPGFPPAPGTTLQPTRAALPLCGLGGPPESHKGPPRIPGARDVFCIKSRTLFVSGH